MKERKDLQAKRDFFIKKHGLGPDGEWDLDILLDLFREEGVRTGRTDQLKELAGHIEECLQVQDDG